MVITYEKIKYYEEQLIKFFDNFKHYKSIPSKKDFLKYKICNNEASAKRIAALFNNPEQQQPIDYIIVAVLYHKWSGDNIWENTHGDKTFLFQTKTSKRVRELYKFLNDEHKIKQKARSKSKHG